MLAAARGGSRSREGPVTSLGGGRHLSLSPLLPLAPLSLHAMPLVVVGIAGHCCSGLRAIVARLRLTMCWEAPAPLWVSAIIMPPAPLPAFPHKPTLPLAQSTASTHSFFSRHTSLKKGLPRVWRKLSLLQIQSDQKMQKWTSVRGIRFAG